jgi:hypothetical protein
MPLVSCPDCGKQISDLARACIGCGRPINATEEITPTRLEARLPPSVPDAPPNLRPPETTKSKNFVVLGGKAGALTNVLYWYWKTSVSGALFAGEFIGSVIGGFFVGALACLLWRLMFRSSPHWILAVVVVGALRAFLAA